MAQQQVEAVFWRHFAVYRSEHESIEDAVSFLNYGEDYGTLSSVGVFVNGEPHLTDCYVRDGRAPTSEEAAEMRDEYRSAQTY